MENNTNNQEDMEAKSAAEKVYEKKGTMWGVAKVPAHRHNGVDSNQVAFSDIQNRVFLVPWTVVGTSAATATNYGTFFTAPYNCTVIGFTEVHQTAGTDGGTVSIQLEKLTGTQAPDSGIVLLSSALSLKTTANTVQTGSLVGLLSTKQMYKGDRLCLKDAGVLTTVSNVNVDVVLQF